MAGSDEFKKGLSLAQRNEKARERIAADPERAAARLGMVDRNKYDLSGYSDKDIIWLSREESLLKMITLV